MTFFVILFFYTLSYQIKREEKKVGVLKLDYLSEYRVDHIYHMTHIDNLKSIIKHGLRAHGNQHQKNDISNGDVNSRRSHREPIYGKKIHSYVPFYFSPRNAMLFVQDFPEDIVILVLDASVLYEDDVIFTDGNAASQRTEFYSDLNELDRLDWQCIRANYWGDFYDGKRKKMAEILVPKKVDSKDIKVIVCQNESSKKRVRKIIDNSIVSYVDKKFYF